MSAVKFGNRVQETTATTGTGTLSLGGAVAQFQTFVSGIGNGNACNYTILDGNGTDWEVGIGTVTSGSPATLSRDTVLDSSNSGSKISISGTGTTKVFCTRVNVAGLFEEVASPVPTGSSSGFTTWLNQPTSSTVSDDANGIALFEPSQGSVHTFALRKKDVSAVSTPYQYDAIIHAAVDARPIAFHGPVFGWSDGTGAHFIHGQFDNKLGVGYVSSLTGATFNWETGFPESDATPWYGNACILIARLKNDGTNLIFSVSRDGVHWRQLGSYAKGSRLSNQNNLIFGADNHSVASTHVLTSFVKSL